MYFLVNFCTILVQKWLVLYSFWLILVQKRTKIAQKMVYFLLYLWIKRINVALINNKWYAYLHKLPPIGVYNMVYTMLNIRFCIQYSAYYMVFHTISLCVE